MPPLTYNPFSEEHFKRQQSPLGPAPQPALPPLPGPAAPVPMDMPGLVTPRMAEPTPALPAPPPSHIRYSQNGGPMKEWLPGQQPTKGTFSAPTAVQTPEEKAASISALDTYDMNGGNYAALAQRHQALAEAEKADYLREAYAAGVNPQATTGVSSQVSSRLYDDNGQVIGYITRGGQRVFYDEPAGRGTPASYEERKDTATRNVTGVNLDRLEELARNHQDAIGYYAYNLNKLNASGKLGDLLGPLDPEVAEMHTLADDLANRQIYEQSGKTINEEEFKRLLPTLPKTNQRPEQFWVAFNKFKQDLKAKGISIKGTGQAPEATPTPGAAPSPTPAPSSAPPVEKRRIRL